MKTIQTQHSSGSLLVSLLIFMLFLLGGLFLGQFFSVLVAFAFGVKLTTIASGNLESVPRVALLLMQFVVALSLFVIAPLMFLFTADKLNLKQRFSTPSAPAFPLILLLVPIVLCSFPFSGYLVGLNEGMQLPEAWADLEAQLRAMEDSAKQLISNLIQFESFGYFLLAFVVIAVLPGVGEELVFRGVLQNYLLATFRNPHVAIWTSAVLFSALHMQFYGFLPRMVLGALFGYLYHWSGKLIFPMVAHALNNGFTLVMVYLNHKGLISLSLEDTESVPLVWALASLVVTGGLLYFFKERVSERKERVRQL